jgi:adenylate cyclase
MPPYMWKILSKRRFEVAALGVAVAVTALHRWSETTPVVDAGAGKGARAGNALLRGIHTLEGRLSDLQFVLRGPRAPHPDVLVVAVDEASASRYGLWPWPRDLVAQGIERLTAAGAASVGLDITFTDEVPDPRAEVLRAALGELETVDAPPGAQAVLADYRQRLQGLTGPSPDVRLAQALAASPQVVQGIFFLGEEEAENLGSGLQSHHDRAQKFLIRAVAGASPLSERQDVSLADVRTFRKPAGRMPLHAFSEAGSRIGFLDSEPDPDGTIRRMPLFALLTGSGGALPVLSLETAAAYHGARPQVLYSDHLNQVVGARIRRGPGQPPLVVPSLFVEPASLVNFEGPASVFPTLSFADVVDGTFDPAQVKGKAVLVGVTLLGNYDQRVTPFAAFEPGVFIHASLLSNILKEDFLTRPAPLTFLELGFILLSALLLAMVLPRVGFRWKLVVIASLLGGYLGFDQLMFTRGWQLATLLPAVNVLACAFTVIFLGYLSADTERQRLAQAFQYRVGPKVMQEMMLHPEKFKQGGERRELSVLFSDIRGFTSIAERMSPEELTRFINEYLTPMTDIVFETDGTLDKYIGDAVMAFWGAPVDQADHAQRACTAALKMLERLEGLKKEWRAAGRPDFDIGVGINSGPMSVGFMGSKIRGDYTVMGDAVNLASRLEGTNKEYETRILISESTWEQVKDHFTGRRLGAVRVKGKRRPVRIYELRGFGKPQGTEAEGVALFEAALEAYGDRRFAEAADLFRQVLTRWPDDPPAQRYLEELAVFENNPPGPAWDGVYTATSK